MTTLFAAHRGGSRVWAENSLTAFRNALALGAPLLELDVHLTRDGRLAVIHDAAVTRTTDGTGPVSDLTMTELSALHLKGPDGRLTDDVVAELDDVLALVAPTRAGLLVEVKGPAVAVHYERRGDTVRAIEGPRYEGLEEGLLGTLHRRGMSERAAIIAFNPGVLRRVHELAPPQRTTLLVAQGHVAMAGAAPADVVGWAVAAGAVDVGLQHTLADEDVVRRAHGAGLSIGVWVVDDEAGMRRFAALGVDAITTDRPDVARRVLGGLP